MNDPKPKPESAIRVPCIGPVPIMEIVEGFKGSISSSSHLWIYTGRSRRFGAGADDPFTTNARRVDDSE